MYAARDVWTRDAYVRTAVNYAAAVTEEVRRQQDAVFAAKAQLESALQKEQAEFERRLERRRVRRATVQRRTQRGAVAGLCQEVEQELFAADLAKQRAEEEARLRAEYPLAYLDDETENALSGYMLLPVLQAKLAQLVHAQRGSAAQATPVHGANEEQKEGQGYSHTVDAGTSPSSVKRVKREETRTGDAREEQPQPNHSGHAAQEEETKRQSGSQASQPMDKDHMSARKWGSASSQGGGAYLVPRPRMVGMAVPRLCARQAATVSSSPYITSEASIHNNNNNNNGSSGSGSDASHVSADAHTSCGADNTTNISSSSNGHAAATLSSPHVRVPAWLAAAAEVPAALDFVRQAWQLDLRRQEKLLRQRRVYLQEELDIAVRASDTARVEQMQRALDELHTEQTRELRELSTRRAQMLAQVVPSVSLAADERTDTPDTSAASAAHAAHTHDNTQCAANTTAQQATRATSAEQSTSAALAASSTDKAAHRPPPRTTSTAIVATTPPAVPGCCEFYTIALPREDGAENNNNNDVDDDITSSNGVSLAWYRQHVQRYIWPTAVERAIGHSLYGIVRPTRLGWRPATNESASSAAAMLTQKKRENKLSTTYKKSAGFLPSSALRGFLHLAGRGDFLCAQVNISNRPTKQQQ